MKIFNTASSALAIIFLLGTSETNAVALRMMQQPVKPLVAQ